MTAVASVSGIASLTGKALDEQVYRVACKRLNKAASEQEFEDRYQQGGFHFQSDAALLGELLGLYEINLHRLGGEWLAFKDSVGCYGDTPSEAACRWLVTHFGR
ncbi:Hypothetical protein HDN1F_34540 [gamma proteobacterium HdN1]|nr:Hypothetical protein HDN1F_34540 [gamma proteobacterium HdN1]